MASLTSFGARWRELQIEHPRAHNKAPKTGLPFLKVFLGGGCLEVLFHKGPFHGYGGLEFRASGCRF